MSIEAENIEHEVSVEVLLVTMIEKLSILIRHMECSNGEIYTEEDLDK